MHTFGGRHETAHSLCYRDKPMAPACSTDDFTSRSMSCRYFTGSSSRYYRALRARSVCEEGHRGESSNGAGGRQKVKRQRFLCVFSLVWTSKMTKTRCKGSCCGNS